MGSDASSRPAPAIKPDKDIEGSDVRGGGGGGQSREC